MDLRLVSGANEVAKMPSPWMKAAPPPAAEQLPSKAVKKKPAAKTPAGTWQSRLMPIRPIGGYWAGDGATGR